MNDQFIPGPALPDVHFVLDTSPTPARPPAPDPDREAEEKLFKEKRERLAKVAAGPAAPIAAAEPAAPAEPSEEERAAASAAAERADILAYINGTDDQRIADFEALLNAKDPPPPPPSPIVVRVITFKEEELTLDPADLPLLAAAYVGALGGGAIPVTLTHHKLELRSVDVIRILEAWHGAA